jgi:RNA polymerase-binding transcription factor DksA
MGSIEELHREKLDQSNRRPRMRRRKKELQKMSAATLHQVRQDHSICECCDAPISQQ